MPDGKIQLAFGSTILALLVVGAGSYQWVAASAEGGRWVEHSHQVLEGIDDLRLAMRGIESDSRGFALTGEGAYLASYQAGLVRVRQGQAIVRQDVLAIGNADRQRQLPLLESLAAQQLQNAATIIDLRRTDGLPAVIAALGSRRDDQESAEFQAAAGRLKDEERQSLALHNAGVERRSSLARIVLVLGTILAVLIAGALAWRTRRDGAARLAALRALRDSDEKYRMLLDGVRDYAIVMLDPQGHVASWSAGAQRIKGYTAGQIMGHSFSSFFLPEAVRRGRPGEILQVAAASGRHEEYGMRVRKDGSQFLADVILTALRDPAGNLRGFSEISRDLSESKESEAKYRGLLEAAPDAMVVVNQGGEIVLLNVQAEKQFGYRRDELVGQKVKNIIPEGFAERLIADALRSAEDALAQQIGTGIELYGRRRDGSVFPIEIMLSPLESAEGILVTAAIRNISARKKAEAHLMQKVEELNRSNEELGQFAYLASHDLQEPLRMVASYTQLLSRRYKGKLDSDADEFIAFAVDGASRMQRLIQGLLTYSHVGTKGRDMLGISSEEALEQALMNLGHAIEESGAVVTHDPLPTVLADETQLIQLFQNLVGNAIKYQGPGIPRVHIAASEDDTRKWLFSVQDNGLGIEPQYFEKIFGMFQRLHKREEFAGTGIGLAICRKIVERHGGSISVESRLGNGSTFRFALAGSENK